jgi:Arc/MetJ family transcription regulator
MAKTAINIDRDLAARAAELLGTETLTATVEEALREVVARAERRAAFQWFRDNPFTPEERELMRHAGE